MQPDQEASRHVTGGTGLFAEGFAVAAEYHTPTVPAYRNNPYLEALPPTIGRDDAKRAMAYYPPYDSGDRLASDFDREHMASLLMSIRHPVGMHGELHSRLSRLIRNGYVARNPMRPFFQPDIDARVGALTIEGSTARGQSPNMVVGSSTLGVGARPTSTGLTFLGVTGIGKTAAMEMCLGFYPQLIVHSEYRGERFTRTQIVYMRLTVGKDGSILGLCHKFFTAVDELHARAGMNTDYLGQYITERTTVDRAIPRMARVAAQHGLGILVIDEVQDLQQRGARAMLSFLVELVNTVGVPVVLVGGIDARPVLLEQFRQARRGASEGDMIVGRAEPGREWRALCEVFWRYQYTRQETPLTDRLVQQLYEESQGITQYLVLAYKLAQIRAISTGSEQIVPAIIRSIRDSLSIAGPVLDALRESRNDPSHRKLLERCGDVVPPEGVMTIPFVRGDVGARATRSELRSSEKPGSHRLTELGTDEMPGPGVSASEAAVEQTAAPPESQERRATRRPLRTAVVLPD